MSMDRRLIEDMFTELALLQRCSGLICLPSQFTVLARAALPDDRLSMLRPSLISRVVVKLTRLIPQSIAS